MEAVYSVLVPFYDLPVQVARLVAVTSDSPLRVVVLHVDDRLVRRRYVLVLRAGVGCQLDDFGFGDFLGGDARCVQLLTRAY